MKKILGLISSQRKLANGEILMKEALQAIGEEVTLEMVRLPELNLEPCRACYSCLIPNQPCPTQDDLYFLLNLMKEADGIIWATPCYALGPAAITKLWGDRIIALAQNYDALLGKPCVIIGTYGIQGWEGYTLSALIANARFLGLDVKDAHLFIGALPGESLENPASVERARELGRALFGEARQSQAGECPTCWSDIWKFSSPSHAVCPLCGQEADLIPSDNTLLWNFGPAGSRFESEKLKEHFQIWLNEQVQEFKSRRKELALLRNPYKGEDTWIKPS